MTDSSPQNTERLWLISGLLFLGAAAGAVSLLLGYGSPSGRRAQQDASSVAEQSPNEPPRPAAQAADSPSISVVPKLPLRPTAPGRTPDEDSFLDQRFPYQVIADVKRPSPEETEQQVRAAFPDYARVLDDSAKNPVIAGQAPAAAPRLPEVPRPPQPMPLSDAER